MRTPERIQRRRIKGWRMPPLATYVGRGTRWGNPAVLNTSAKAGAVSTWVRDRETAARMYRHAVTAGGMTVGVEHWSRGEWHPVPSVEEICARLAGRDLACWCPLPVAGDPDHCHAAVLLEIANTDA